jgi:hypothetical protein
MAKPELVPPKDEPKPWTPDQPLDDEDDEKETQRRARAEARLNHLKTSYEKPPDEPGKKKKKLW